MTDKPHDLYAVIGHPVDRLRSPGLFNRSLSERGQGGTAVAMDVLPEGLADVVCGLRRLANLRGFMVTMPHKERIGPLLDHLTEPARVSGAVNIVRRTESGALEGGQLDGAGFVAAMRGNGCDPAGRHVVVVGAGGVAAGIAFALAEAGAGRITLANRTRARAEALAARLQDAFPNRAFGVSDVGSVDTSAAVFINATSLGTDDADPLPFDPDIVAEGAYVGDVVNRAGDTPLLARARRRGLAVQHGQEMVVPQIALMHRFFARS